MLRLGMEEDVPIESRLITKRIAKAQESVEAMNFGARKHLLEYDDVMNKQRKAVYGMRRGLIEGLDQKDRIQDMVRGIVQSFVESALCRERARNRVGPGGPSHRRLKRVRFQDRVSVAGRSETRRHRRRHRRSAHPKYEEKERTVGSEIIRETERMIMLHVIDDQWKDHLLTMDHLKEGIGLRGYGQKDPLVEYKKESFVLFQEMMDRIEDETVRYLFFLQPVPDDRAPLPYRARRGPRGRA